MPGRSSLEGRGCQTCKRFANWSVSVAAWLNAARLVLVGMDENMFRLPDCAKLVILQRLQSGRSNVIAGCQTAGRPAPGEAAYKVVRGPPVAGRTSRPLR